MSERPADVTHQENPSHQILPRALVAMNDCSPKRAQIDRTVIRAPADAVGQEAYILHGVSGIFRDTE
jgi:hypothetical protein